MAVTITGGAGNITPVVEGNKKVTRGALAFDASYPTGGEVVSAATLGLSVIEDFEIKGAEGGFLFEPIVSGSGNQVTVKVRDASTASAGVFTGTALPSLTYSVNHDASAVTNGTPVYVTASSLAPAPTLTMVSELASEDVGLMLSGSILFSITKVKTENKTIDLIHDASAAANGTALYARILTKHPTAVDGYEAVLVSANANNDDAVFQDNANGDNFPVVDDNNAAEFSFPVYFDEDTTDGQRLQVDAPFGVDLFVRSQEGRFMQLANNSAAAANGVQVYFDDDAANADERLLFVSPTTSNGSNVTNTSNGVSKTIFDNLFQVFIDEDAANEDEKFLADFTNRGGNDQWVALSNGRMLKIKHDAAASSNGVALYVDDNGSGASLGQFIFVSPTTSNTTVEADTSVSLFTAVPSGTIAAPTGTSAAAAEVDNGTDLSSLSSVEFEARGR